MSTEKELQEVMSLVDSHGNACENFGDYQTIKNADACIALRGKIESRLRAILTELEAAREDAARWQEVAFGEGLSLGVSYLDHFGERFVLEGQEAVDVVDAMRKVEA